LFIRLTIKPEKWNDVKMATREEFTKEVRFEIYSCAFCEFVQNSMMFEELEAIDEKKYLFHLKHVHNLEP
jgi:uncharacterized protein (DUF169 family)